MQPRDFQSMQAQAIDYARQMYEKSSQSTNESKFNSGTEACHSHNKYNPSGNNSHFRNNRINNIFSVSADNKGTDADISLILALILLLSKDSGDSILILALLYIMT